MALRSQRFTGKPYYTKGSFNGLSRDSKPTPELLEYWEIRKLNYGSERRKRIIALLQTGFEFMVNCRGFGSTQRDPDLKKLLKLKKIEMYNVKDGCSFTKHTYIRKVSK